MNQKSIWLGTVALGQQFGGIAHVARCSVDALTCSLSHLRLNRVVSLLDSADPGEANRMSGLGGHQFKRCGGSRIRFTTSVLSQAVERPAVVLFDHVDIAQCQTLLPATLRSPYAVWVHGIEVWKQLPKRKLAALCEADLLIFNSHFTKRRFESFHGDRFPSRVVHLSAADVDHHGRPSGHSRKPWILTVGRMEPDRPKGHEQILEAMPEITTAVPDVQWHIVGKGRALEPFRRRVRESSCAGRVHMHGFLANKELQELFRQCRVFAMPSFGEGFGIVYLEAMQQGCVPIGSTLDAASEVIGDGGICVDVEDRVSLERQLKELLTESDEQFERRSQRARARADEFSPARFQENLLEALDHVLATGGHHEGCD